MTKINPEIKAEWLDALRDGSREQGTGALNDNGKMCCLGVLSDVAAEKGVCKKSTSAFDDGTISYDGDTFYLPATVAEWAGFGEGTKTGEGESFPHNPFFFAAPEDAAKYSDHLRGPDNKVYLSMLNDAGWTFEQIADVIEDEF